MVKFDYIIALLLLIFSACNSQGKKSADELTNEPNEEMKLEFNFYPSSGGQAIYIIGYSDDGLYIKNLEPTENQVTEFKKLLNENEKKRIQKAISELKKREDIQTEIVSDAWRVELIIDGVVYFNESDVKLETLPTDVKNILNLLIEGSTVKIDLHEFS